jgi:UTP pyrophosphatase
MSTTYLNGYPADTVQQIEALRQAQKLGPWLLKKYPAAHGLRDDRALFAYVQDLKQEYLKGAQQLSKVLFDNKLQVVKNALGTHTTISRVQGSRLMAKREIRIASLFKDTPLAFLRMIAVHELAHLREHAHDKNFYKLCSYMEPDYHQLEFEVRVYLTYLESNAQRLWS